MRSKIFVVPINERLWLSAFPAVSLQEPWAFTMLHFPATLTYASAFAGILTVIHHGVTVGSLPPSTASLCHTTFCGLCVLQCPGTRSNRAQEAMLSFLSHSSMASSHPPHPQSVAKIPSQGRDIINKVYPLS